MPGLEISDPTAYTSRMKTLVGDRDPLAILESTPGMIAAVVERHGRDTLRARPFPGKWTPLEIIGHLVDVEWAFGWRIRHGMADAAPVIQGFDQDRWVDRFGHNDADPKHLADTFGVLRREAVATWRLATPADLQKTVHHLERGKEQLGLWRTLLAGHDLHHLDQLDRYLAAVAG